MNRHLINIVVAAVSGLAAGATASYFITKKVVADKYETILDVEIASVKEHFQNRHDMLHKQGDFETPEQFAEKLELDKLLRAYTTTSLTETEAGLELKISVNDREPNPNDEDEDEPINPDEPYIISEEDFAETHLEYGKELLTYYELDDTLSAAEGEGTIDEVNSLVGNDSLTKFGHKSNDQNVVYVRNRRLACDFEITRKEGAYNEIVLTMRSPKAKRKRMPRPELDRE